MRTLPRARGHGRAGPSFEDEAVVRHPELHDRPAERRVVVEGRRRGVVHEMDLERHPVDARTPQREARRRGDDEVVGCAGLGNPVGDAVAPEGVIAGVDDRDVGRLVHEVHVARGALERLAQRRDSSAPRARSGRGRPARRDAPARRPMVRSPRVLDPGFQDRHHQPMRQARVGPRQIDRADARLPRGTAW